MLDTVLLARDKWLKPTGCGKIYVDFLNDKFQGLHGRGGSLDPAFPLLFSTGIPHPSSRLQKLVNLRLRLTLSIDILNLRLF